MQDFSKTLYKYSKYTVIIRIICIILHYVILLHFLIFVFLFEIFFKFDYL